MNDENEDLTQDSEMIRIILEEGAFQLPLNYDSLSVFEKWDINTKLLDLVDLRLGRKVETHISGSDVGNTLAVVLFFFVMAFIF